LLRDKGSGDAEAHANTWLSEGFRLEKWECDAVYIRSMYAGAHASRIAALCGPRMPSNARKDLPLTLPADHLSR